MGSCRSLYTNNVDKIKNSKYMKEKVVNIFPDVVPEKDIHAFRILHTQSSHDYKYMTVSEAFKYRTCNDIYHKDSISKDMYMLHVIDENT